MPRYDLIPVDDPSRGDFAVRITDDSLAPLFSPGQTAYLIRSTQLRDGDVGLFYSTRGMVFRQFCQDSVGNVYLFSLDRSRRGEDLLIPHGGQRPVCYGKLLLDKPVPLPMD